MAAPTLTRRKAMNRILRSLVILAALCAAVPVAASDSHGAAADKAVTKTVTGEVVDMGCYLGHGAHGKDHISCATKCLAKGMPIGVLTTNGTLYLVTLDHDNGDPYNSL